MIKKIFFLFITVLTSSIIFSLDFNISPNSNGTMDIDLGLDWDYSPGVYSGIHGKYQNVYDNSETSDQYVATSGTVMSMDIDLLGYRLGKRRFRFDIALNTQFQNMDLREIGYIDASDTRYFILNDRVLNLILPRIKGEINYNNNSLKFSIGGEYSPWLNVSLDQELTISPGLDEISFSSSQSAYNAFSVNSKIRLSNLFISPELSAEYDYLAIKYDVYTAGGEATIDTLLQTLTTDLTLILNIINLKGLHPTITYGYIWDWTTDITNNSSPVLEKKTILGFGFEF